MRIFWDVLKLGTCALKGLVDCLIDQLCLVMVKVVPIVQDEFQVAVELCLVTGKKVLAYFA